MTLNSWSVLGPYLVLCHAVGGTRGFVCARQVFYQLSYRPSPTIKKFLKNKSSIDAKTNNSQTNLKKKEYPTNR